MTIIRAVGSIATIVLAWSFSASRPPVRIVGAALVMRGVLLISVQPT